MATKSIPGTINTENPETEETTEETPETSSEEIQRTAEKVEAKVEKTKKKVEKITGERQNLIGDLAKPNVEDPEFDLKAWANSVDKRLDAVLKGKKYDENTKPVETPQVETKKPAWWDKEIL